MSFGAASFSGIDPSYSLPDNVALLTLQVPLLQSPKLYR
jgi:alpha-mannosidase